MDKKEILLRFGEYIMNGSMADLIAFDALVALCHLGSRLSSVQVGLLSRTGLVARNSDVSSDVKDVIRTCYCITNDGSSQYVGPMLREVQ